MYWSELPRSEMWLNIAILVLATAMMIMGTVGVVLTPVSV